MKQASTRMLFSYWDALRGERAAPERSEIEPGAIRHALPDAFILEIEPDGSARMRLAGTRLCALIGRELKGGAFQDLFAAGSREELRRCLEAVLADTDGIVAGAVGATASGRRLELELLLLPLRHHAHPHTRALGAIAPVSVPSWIGFDVVAALELVSARVLRTPRPERRLLAPSVSRSPKLRRFVVVEGGRAGGNEGGGGNSGPCSSGGQGAGPRAATGSAGPR